jgi:hypothetical protein
MKTHGGVIHSCTILDLGITWKYVATIHGPVAYPSTVKIEAVCFSETSLDFQRTTRRYMPGDIVIALHHSYEHITSYLL